MKSIKPKISKIFIFSLIFLFGCFSYGQVPIENDTVLIPFFEKLQLLEKNHNHSLTIVHIGDSHLQNGMMTDRIRDLLQERFGNSGYGFTFPYVLAKTNGSDLFRFETNSEWESQRIVFEDLGYPVGLSGIALLTTKPDFYLKMKLENPKYDFNQIKIFTPKNQILFLASETETAGNEAIIQDSIYYRVNFKNKINQLYLLPNGVHPSYALNGLILENGEAGILYHSIGINGAKFLDYNKYQLFFEQLSALKPDLIIISLGTNGAFDKADYSVLDFENQMNEFLENLKNHQISAPMLFTTPPPALRSKKDQNPKVIEFGNDIIRRSTEINYASWNLYQFLGGYENSDQLIKDDIWAADRIHFTKKGYQMQADGLVGALLNSYLKFTTKTTE